LKAPHQTYDQLLQDMIESEHARRLTEDIETIRNKGRYRKLEF